MIFFNFIAFYLNKIYDLPNIILNNNNQLNEEFLNKIFIKKFINSICIKKIFIEIIPEFYKNKKEIFNIINKFSREIISFNRENLYLKFVIIYNLENIDRLDQIYFKPLLDKYSLCVKFIIFCNDSKNLINPIRSRFINVSSKKKITKLNYKLYFKLKKFFNLNIMFLISNNCKINKKEFYNVDLFLFLSTCKILKNYSRGFIKSSNFLSNEFYFLLLEFFKFNKIKNFNIKIKYKIKFSNLLISLNLTKLLLLFFLMKIFFQ
jgi:hypothetical protein